MVGVTRWSLPAPSLPTADNMCLTCRGFERDKLHGATSADAAAARRDSDSERVVKPIIAIAGVSAKDRWALTSGGNSSRGTQRLYRPDYCGLMHWRCGTRPPPPPPPPIDDVQGDGRQSAMTPQQAQRSNAQCEEPQKTKRGHGTTNPMLLLLLLLLFLKGSQTRAGAAIR